MAWILPISRLVHDWLVNTVTSWWTHTLECFAASHSSLQQMFLSMPRFAQRRFFQYRNWLVSTVSWWWMHALECLVASLSTLKKIRCAVRDLSFWILCSDLVKSCRLGLHSAMLPPLRTFLLRASFATILRCESVVWICHKNNSKFDAALSPGICHPESCVFVEDVSLGSCVWDKSL